MSSQTDPLDGGRPREPLSPEEATRLWEQHRLGSGEPAEESLDRLYRALYGPLVEFLRLKGCDPELADDVACATWVRLIAASIKPAVKRNFPAYLRKVAWNRLKESRRSRRRELAHEQDPITTEEPTARLERDERVQAVNLCIEELPAEERAFIHNMLVHGLTQQAAAKLARWRGGATSIHRRYLKIRAALARCLKKKGIF